MKSIKPGRGPSKRSFVSSIFGVVFGVIWTIAALGIAFVSGFNFFALLFPLFGVCFVAMAIYDARIAWQNAHGKDRMSLYDVVDSHEEPDPWSPDYEQQKQHQNRETARQSHDREEANFCPYCGKPIEKDYRFCKYCGKSLI